MIEPSRVIFYRAVLIPRQFESHICQIDHASVSSLEIQLYPKRIL